MKRRIPLGAIDDHSLPAIVPSVFYANGGKELVIKFAIKSKTAPEPNPSDPNPDPERDTHREVFEKPGGSIFGTNLKVQLFGLSKDSSTMQITMDINSKIPGTGGADLLPESAPGKKKSNGIPE